MENDRKAPFRGVYARLLGLYPRAFRERFSESMEQAFDDLWKEQQTASVAAALGFTTRMAAETPGGILKEHASRLMQGDNMNSFRSIVVGAAGASHTANYYGAS
ncbi:MAG TPA: hypothetical protein VNA17_05690 [Pyrinomonadaceae bacterium]|nr:hypothetical protein [Pyrinomonadaceae bacterium]